MRNNKCFFFFFFSPSFRVDTSKVVSKRSAGKDLLRGKIEAQDFQTTTTTVQFPEVGVVYQTSVLLKDVKKDIMFSKGNSSTDEMKITWGERGTVSLKVDGIPCGGIKVCQGCGKVFAKKKLTCCQGSTLECFGDDCPGFFPPSFLLL